MQFKSVSVILGAVNETDSLKTVVDFIIENCGEDIDKILLIKAQSCTPECRATVESLVLKYPEKVTSFVQNRPMIGGAIRDGIDVIEASHTILYSSDLAHDLCIVPQMIDSAKKDPETICTASRWIGGKFYGYSKVKLVLNYLAQIFLRVLFHQKLTDMTNPTQIAPTELYRSINWESCGFPFLLEATLKPVKLGCKFTEISTNCYSRTQGKSSNSFKQTAAYFKTALHIKFMKKEDCLKK